MTDRHILQNLITQVPFRVHNVKMHTAHISDNDQMLLLRYYDRLEDDVKAQVTLDLPLLRCMSDTVSRQDAALLLGVATEVLATPVHVKLIGTVVLAFDELSMALFLNFTNTAKNAQVLFLEDFYTASADEQKKRALLFAHEAHQIAFCGNVFVLYKHDQVLGGLMSMDMEGGEWSIQTQDSYIRLPNSHAMATTHTLNTLKDHQPNLFEAVIQAVQDRTLGDVSDMD